MIKTNKKGFTLVELLAVIVILGVLLLIAVPSVTNIIEGSKKKTFVSAAKLSAENIETLVSVNDYTGTCFLEMDDTDIPLERGDYGDINGIVLVEGGDVKVYAYDGATGTAIFDKTLKQMSSSTFAPTNESAATTLAKVKAKATSYFDTSGNIKKDASNNNLINKCSF